MVLKNIEDTRKMNSFNSAHLLRELLVEARSEGRVACGVYHAAQIMEKCPSSIMLCILPQNHMDDAETHIHSVLIEAFCFDNNIRLLKVDSEEKLSEILNIPRNSSGRYRQLDYRCVLIKHPKELCSKTVESFIQYYKENYSDAYPQPILELPV
ncbi:growth arrest and DNA damage-inducible protein GADD45 beta [Centruroides vittatus]|uniref:growth arrest and DNA damage-inducible protein GADD45 beta n=1 Tax=Centruroides vittatus TaxID=120091 RepID=UPI00351055C0